MLNKNRQLPMISFQDLSVKIRKIRPVFISGLVSNVITYTKAPSLETASFFSDVANI